MTTEDRHRIGVLWSERAQAGALIDALVARRHHCTRLTGSEDAYPDRAGDAIGAVVVEVPHRADSAPSALDRIGRLRACGVGPVLAVGAGAEEAHIVAVLEAGADDYALLPMSTRELVVRLEALLRRDGPSGRWRTFPPYRFDTVRRTLEIDGEAVTLTTKEFALALAFFEHAGETLSRRLILDTVWRTTPDLATRTVDTHVAWLRRKLGLVAPHRWQLVTVYRAGYRLETVDADADARRDTSTVPAAVRKALDCELEAARTACRRGGDAAARARLDDVQLALGTTVAGRTDGDEAAENDARIAAAMRAILRQREPDRSICPSEVARLVGGADWRALMPDVRRVAWSLQASGWLAITQRGVVLDAPAPGPIRLATAATAATRRRYSR